MMDTPRLVLLVIFCISLFMLGENWYKTYGPKPLPRETTTAPTAKGDMAPIPDGGPSTRPLAKATAEASVPAAAPGSAGEVVTVRTDLMLVEVGTLGGDIRRVELLTLVTP